MLIWCLALLAAACVLAAVFGRALGRNAGYLLAIPLLAAAGLLIVTIGGDALTGDPALRQDAVTASWSWIPSLGVDVALRLDGLSLLFGLLVTVIGAGVLIYSARYLRRGTQTSFYVLMSVFALAMLALVLADDVIVLFIAWEFTTLCSFFLIARSGENAREPAIRTLLVTVLGGLALLAAAATMTVNAGTTRISDILESSFWSDDPSAAAWVTVLLAIAAFTKSAQFPFQAWLPDSMVAITPVSAYLHAAAMVKAGIYLLLRFSPAMEDSTLWTVLLVTSGGLTALIGGIAALRRTDLKELLAYSTISQLGFIIVMIGVGTPESLTAALVHTVAHALFKAVLFMVVGIVDHEAGTRDIRELAARRVRMPITTTIAALAALSMAGVPPLLGFVSKEVMFDAYTEGDMNAILRGVVLAVSIATAILTFAYAARFVLGLRGGRSGATVTDARASFWSVPALLALACVILGIAPGLLNSVIAGAGAEVIGVASDPDLALWHGVNTALLISLGVIGTGILLVLLRRPIERFMQPRAFPFSALTVVDATRSGTIGLGAKIDALLGTDAPRRHLVIPVVCVIAFGAFAIWTGPELPAVVGQRSQPLDWVLVSLVLAGTIGAVVAATRMAAIIVMGVVGSTMTLWFLWLGAADVALTQLLVEILTVCVLVLVLRMLPRRFEPNSAARRIVAGAIAIAAGAMTTVAVLALTGRRELSDAATWYLQNAERESGGGNIVNTILVDFRALDTLGELTVLGFAGVAVAVLLHGRRKVRLSEGESGVDDTLPIADAQENSVFTRTLTRVAGPLVILLSLILLLRGHYEPGGGFIAALVGGAGFALLYLSAPSDSTARVRWPFILIIGAGIVIGAATGLAGFVDGSFLRPLHAELFGTKLTSALAFDVGVYLAVVGTVLAALNLLGLPTPPSDPAERDDAAADGDGPTGGAVHQSTAQPADGAVQRSLAATGSTGAHARPDFDEGSPA